nr:MAG TPA: hypothetical protein [Caudoviricetes sp.]
MIIKWYHYLPVCIINILIPGTYRKIKYFEFYL